MGNILLSTSTTNIMNGLDYAYKDGEGALWTVTSQYIAPVVLVILAGIFLFILCSSGVTLTKMHAQWEEHAYKLITLIVIMVLVGGYWRWGAIMLGKEPTQPTASIVQTEYIEEGDSKLWMQLER